LWKPDSGKTIAPNNPLHKLIDTNENKTDLKNSLLNLPYQQLKEISNKLTKEIEDK
jgi:hypothetical protein